MACVMPWPHLRWSGPAAPAEEGNAGSRYPTGGLVTHPFQHEVDIPTSTERRDAMELINRKCPDGSRVQKEGEMPKVSRAADRAWRGQMGGERLWEFSSHAKRFHEPCTALHQTLARQLLSRVIHVLDLRLLAVVRRNTAL